MPAPVPGSRSGAAGAPVSGRSSNRPAQVGAGLGVHGPADSLVELGLVQAAVAEVLGQAVGDRLPLGVGNPHVLVLEAGPANSGEKPRPQDWLYCEGHDDVPR